jgi:glycosyltransferase involved in cell wall biosynthesis
MVESPRVTLVTPVYNGMAYLADTLASVRAQGLDNLEYIVCDGGSTDGSWELIEANRDLITHAIREPDRGMYDALMKGFGRATGDILGWINSDDLLMSWCVSCVRTYFREVPECRWLTGVPSLFNGAGQMVWVAQVAPRYRSGWIRRGWYSGRGLGPIQQESTFFRRDLFEQVGGLDRTMRLAGDFDLWRRFAVHAELHQVGTVLAGFRLHGKNLTANIGAYYQEGGAVAIPGGKLLGAAYSFVAFLLERRRKAPRLDRMLLSQPPG